MFKKIISFVLAMFVFVSALSISAFAAGEGASDLVCPWCGSRVQVSRSSISWCQDEVVYMCSKYGAGCDYKRVCETLKGTDLSLRNDGSNWLPYQGSHSNTATVPKNYYTTNNNSSTTNYNTVNSGTTNHYSTINTTNRTLNYTTYNQTTNNYVRNTYNYTNYTYNYDYNYYTVNVDNSTHYVIDNVNYITVLYPTGETVKDESGNDVPEYDYTDIYYELPDGRNSYNLSANDIWGTYFIYNVTGCEKVAEDDGTTLGLWHLDGDFKDSSYHAGKITPFFGSSVFENSESLNNSSFGKCLLFSDLSEYLTMASFPRSAFLGNTLEYKIYLPDADDVVFGFSDSSVSSGFVGFSGVDSSDRNFNGNVRTFFRVGAGVHSIAFQFSNNINVGSVFTATNSLLDVYLDGALINTSIVGNNDRYSNVNMSNKYVFSYFPAGLTVKYSNYFFIALAKDVQYLDEVRLSKGHLYGNLYTPSLQPFDTNSVLVRPSNPSDKDIAIMSNIPVGNYRIGGVRPTYPAKGDVYIYLENDVVESVQQYQGDGWAAVDAEIYTDGTWKTLKKFNLATVKSEEVEIKPTPSPSPSPDTPTPTPGGSTGCTHQYTITKEKEPTCTESGYKIYKCDLCGDTYTDSIKALGHDWHIVSENALSNDETSDSSPVSESTPAPESSVAPDASPPPAESGSETVEPTPTPAPTYTLYRCSRCNMEYKDFDGSGPPQNKDDEEEGGLWGWVKKLFGSIWNGLLSILEIIVGGTIDLVCKLIDDLVVGVNHVITGLFDSLGKIVDFGGAFKDFLGAFFGYLPDEIIILLAFSISLGIILMFIKFFRG